MSKTVRDVLKDLQKLTTREDAHMYLLKSIEENGNAWSNIKYIAGYLGNDERDRILKLFNGR